MTEQMEIDNMTSKTVQYVSPTNPDFIVEANYEMNEYGPHVCFITQYELDEHGNKENVSKKYGSLDMHHMKLEMIDMYGENGCIKITTSNVHAPPYEDGILIEIDTLNQIMKEFKDMVHKFNDMLDEGEY